MQAARESEQQAHADTSYARVSHDSEAVMRFHSAHIDNLRKLYVDQIQHLLSAENQIMEALPKMVAAATDPELKRVLQTHLQETREQVSQLEANNARIDRQAGSEKEQADCSADRGRQRYDR